MISLTFFHAFSIYWLHIWNQSQFFFIVFYYIVSADNKIYSWNCPALKQKCVSGGRNATVFTKMFTKCLLHLLMAVIFCNYIKYNDHYCLVLHMLAVLQIRYTINYFEELGRPWQITHNKEIMYIPKSHTISLPPYESTSVCKMYYHKGEISCEYIRGECNW